MNSLSRYIYFDRLGKLESTFSRLQVQQLDILFIFQLFINRISNDVVTRGLQTVLSELELDFADNLILSFDRSATNKMIETTWKQAEKEVN